MRAKGNNIDKKREKRQIREKKVDKCGQLFFEIVQSHGKRKRDKRKKKECMRFLNSPYFI